MSEERIVRPVPDPTTLTTEQSERLRSDLRREIESLSALIHSEIKGVTSTVETLEKRINSNYDLWTREIDRTESSRKDALDKAEMTTQTALQKAEATLQLSLASAKSDVSQALREVENRITEKLTSTASGVLSLNEEKFSSIAKQFVERDVRTEQAAIATKIAVDAALQAQKEAANAQNESNAAAVAKSEAATTKQIDGINALLVSNVAALNDKIYDVKGRLDRGEGGASGARENRSDSHATLTTGAAIVFGILALVVSIVFGVINRPQPQYATQSPPPAAIAVVPVNPTGH